MSKFLDLINKQRKKKKEKKFEGTFLEYLEELQSNPDIAKPSHKRLYDAIKKHGVAVIDEENPRKKKIFNDDNIKIYDYFKQEFFGNERVIEKLMHFLKSASLRGEESSQVLLLMVLLELVNQPLLNTLKMLWTGKYIITSMEIHREGSHFSWFLDPFEATSKKCWELKSKEILVP